MNPVSDSAEIH